jgi:putative ABC transport system substrate-binding protein
MRRRTFIAGLGSAAAWPLAARAQQRVPMRRIGVLLGGTEGDPQEHARLAALRQGLERLGWSEGRNVRMDTRFAAGSPDQVQTLAKELVALQPDVMLSQSTGFVAALRRESSTIPIAFVNIGDPVGSGFAATLARPGGNLTGFMSFEASIASKWLAMLKEIAPRLARVAFVANPKTAPYDYFLHAAQAAAPSLLIELVSSAVENAADIERTIELFARVANGGLLLPPDVTTTPHRELIIALAAHHRLPAVYGSRVFVADGGLMSYGNDQIDTFRQAASYVVRILQGEKPADLPVQAPVKYELVINLKTAKALGLTIPETLLATADEVIP